MLARKIIKLDPRYSEIQFHLTEGDEEIIHIYLVVGSEKMIITEREELASRLNNSLRGFVAINNLTSPKTIEFAREEFKLHLSTSADTDDNSYNADILKFLKLELFILEDLYYNLISDKEVIELFKNANITLESPPTPESTVTLNNQNINKYPHPLFSPKKEEASQDEKAIIDNKTNDISANQIKVKERL
jgi:hypothetical protein